MTGNSDLIDDLRRLAADRIRALVEPGTPVALLDFPNHANVGDSAIWMGELECFSNLMGAPPAYVCTKENWDPDALQRAAPDATIFLHGGGNFGDLWPEHQAFRESVLARFPGRRIIQLPQSIHFDSARARRRAAAAIAAHGNFVLLVRDHRSYAIAKEDFACDLHLAPDMAFCLGAIPRRGPPIHALLLLLRTDKESARVSACSPLDLPQGAIQVDWLDEDPLLYAKQKRRTALASLLHFRPATWHRSRQQEILFRALAAHRLDRGVRLLSSAAFVITDRLHCHILCMLLGIPHIVFDNANGKLGSFIAAWTGESDLVQIASSIEHALQLWSASSIRCATVAETADA